MNTMPQSSRSLPLHDEADPSAPTSDSPATGDPLTLGISGMSCGHCVNSVRNALSSLPGVTVDHVAIGQARIHLDSSVGNSAAVIDTLREEGYAAEFTTS